jgi:hypothetical protein
MRLVLLVGLLLAAFPFTAAAIPEPLPGHAWASPADGASHPASSWPNATNAEMFSFAIYAEFEDGEFEVEVATSPEADPVDGTLLDAKRVDDYIAPEDPRAEELFSVRTRVDAPWLATLGSYYWQAYYTEDDGTVYATPVQRLDIVERPPPEPPSDLTPERPPPTQPSIGTALPTQSAAPAAQRLSRRSARAMLTRAIRTQAGRSPQKLTSSCTLPTPFLANCNLTWRDARYRYKARAKLTSTAGGAQAKIDGTRTKRACTRRCRSAIHWSVATTG